MPALQISAWLLGAVLIALGAWAVAAPLEVRVVSPGEVASNERIVEIRAVTSGLVRQLHIRNGQHVRAGDVLVSFDDENLKSQKQLTQDKIRKLECKIDNARNELDLLNAHEEEIETAIRNVVPLSLDAFRQNKLPCPDFGNPRNIGLLAETLELAIMQIGNLQQMEASIGKQIEIAGSQLASVREDFEASSVLARKRLINASKSRESERVVRDNELKLVSLNSDRESIESSIYDNKKRAYLSIYNDMKTISSELESFNISLIDEKINLEALNNQIAMRTITAPIDGAAVDVNNFIVANFVQQSDLLLKLLPSARMNIVKARVSIDDIDNIQRQEKAVVSLPTNALLRDQFFEATIETINPITSTDGNFRGAQDYYEVTLRISDPAFNPAVERIYVGMPVNVLFSAERTTLAGAMLRPLTKNWPRIFEQ
ncbi:Type I secretion system membrane fusion protein PrsE [Hartmannibacter diazotrophicus]|uniref:Type I secretion system membrane fusion protein PrsE n=1 Tax=Hartmannibacter diazotrophicus TaxID=1482074 RepID=A0A2C9DEC4_9HYPH|nr:HlyD family efflux transporter periplasmic adaptor subunit [Hartmannibacter diazotrophicus]SON58361.1 Type I secretion system membrane fusion protein PrsE [Hartmannibacter diazotrophicus]